MNAARSGFVLAVALALSSGSAAADEQTTAVKGASQPTVMSDEQLDQIVGGSHIDTIIQALSEHEVWFKGPDDGTVASHLSFALSKIPGHE